MVEGARLESVYTSKGYRGFESRPLRRKIPPRLGEGGFSFSKKAELVRAFLLNENQACGAGRDFSKPPPRDHEVIPDMFGPFY